MNNKEKHLHIDLGNPHYCQWLDFLKKSEKWNKEQIAEYQLSEIKRIVKHAYENTKGYRKLYDDAGINPDSIKTIEDFQKLPFITREILRDNFEDFSTDIKDKEYITTGGSTGVPLGFYRDPVAFGKELASKAHQYYRRDWKEGVRQMVFRGLMISTPDHMEFFPKFNELRCSTYHLIPEWMEVYWKRAIKYKPEWIRGYPSAIYLFAKFLKERNKPFPSLKGILCTSENLYDFQKELIEKVFKTRVFSHYGNFEMAVLAGFCEKEDTYHILPQYGYAELIDEKGKLITEPGKSGEIIGTSFITNATPFIRYKTKDIAILKGWGCPSCHRPYQIWESIEGRVQDFILTSTGRHITKALITAMHDDTLDHIERFQFHQKEKGKVTFKFIPKDTCTEEIIATMKKRWLNRLGDNDLEMEMEPVKKMFLTPRGKHRYIIQEMDIKYGE